MLRRIHVRNFKGIKEGEISDLGSVNVFIGRNNSGKSSILDALCLSKCAFDSMMFGDSVPLLLLGRRGVGRSAYVTRNFWNGYDTLENMFFNLEFEKGEKLDIEIRWNGDAGFSMFLSDPSRSIQQTLENQYFGRIDQALTGHRSEHAGGIDAFATKYPEIRHYMNELALIDDYLARRLEMLETNIYGRIIEPRLDKKVVDELNKIYEVGAEGLTYVPISPSTKGYRLALSQAKQALHIDELGDGAKYATNILSLCLLLENSALLIEEVESHQHSEAIRKFLTSLVEIAHEKKVQLFMTTHSLDVIQILSQFLKEYGIKVFHIERPIDGRLTIRQLETADTRLLSDLGVDLRNLEVYKRFVVVEGDDDETFVKNLFKKYNRNLEEIGYLVKAGSKDLVKQVSGALVPTEREIIAMPDHDRDEREVLISSFANVLRSRSISYTQEDNVLRIQKLNSMITVLPFGMPDDDTLSKVGITQHEMEDYCLKLIEIDENLCRWTGTRLEELVSDAKKAGLKNLNKSNTLLRLLSAKKGILYEDVISHIIQNASKESVDKVTSNIREVLTK